MQQTSSSSQPRPCEDAPLRDNTSSFVICAISLIKPKRSSYLLVLLIYAGTLPLRTILSLFYSGPRNSRR
ncbi:hypothetical protein OE88DRAFT_1664288 [Heliocybe sulcata]|uniref:Uncharacterized protein n=1 Tax=Heliocybe sulcata TaxID=5364 RepID=A0A5C3MWC8_9AGAM|nr:hypothetical protein OE88DRAFT_1664288 [Heliocybe sulcata]